MPFNLIVSAFAEGTEIPRIYTCDGANISPSLEWSGEPRNTASYALVMDDPDAPAGTWNHWLLYDIPPSLHSLAQHYKPDSTGHSGINDFGKAGYGGPCPPKGHGTHRYFFRLYALDVKSLGLPAGAKRDDLDRAIHGHVLAETQYMGRYRRP